MLRIKIKGMDITLHFGFCIMLTGMCYLLGDQIFPCLCCAALHECGHLLCCVWLKIPVKKLEFQFTGLRLCLKRSDVLLAPWKTAVLHGSGILCNLVGAAVFACCGLSKWAAVSLILGLFHSIPMQSMDGGRVLTAIGWKHPEVVTFLGQGIGFLIFALLAAASLVYHQPGMALIAALFALCGILPQRKKR